MLQQQYDRVMVLVRDAQARCRRAYAVRRGQLTIVNLEAKPLDEATRFLKLGLGEHDVQRLRRGARTPTFGIGS